MFVIAVAAAAATAGACKKDDRPKEAAPAETDPAAGRGDAAAIAAIDATAVTADAAGGLASDTLPNPFLWRVDKDGSTLHVLGSIHLGVEPSRLPPAVWTALDGAKTFAMETDLNDLSIMKTVMRDDGSTLEQELGATHWAMLKERIGEQMALGLNTMKAFIAASFLQLQLVPTTAPMDLELRRRAEGAGARIVYLEPPELQQQLLEKWLDARALKAMLDTYDQMKAQAAELIAAYEEGDADRMMPLAMDEKSWLEMGRTKAEFEQMEKEMLFDRNAAWIPRLHELAQGGAFVVVGVGHLLGDGSVLDLLGKDGYTVTRVSAGGH
jgi:uncharacterized protein